MGEPSQEQVDEMIAWGVANHWSEERIFEHVAALERMTDAELAAIGVFPPPPKDKHLSPSMSTSPSAPLSPSRGHAPNRRQRGGGHRAPVEGDKVEEVEEPPFSSSQGDVNPAAPACRPTWR